MKKREPYSQLSDFTDAKLVEDVAREVLVNRFCWVKELGWMKWTGQRWEEAGEDDVIEAVRGWVKEKHLEFAQLLAIGKADDTVVKRWIGIMSAGRISSLAKLARGIEVLKAKAADFDAQPDLLNVANGVIDLRTGQLSHHAPEYKMAKLAPVAYRPGARHADWNKALEAVPEDVRDWYQVRMGQAITGYMTPDDEMIVQLGGGANGKTTVTGAIKKTLGDYAVTVSNKVVLSDPKDNCPEKMVLRGARFALIEETPQARRLSVNMLKDNVGTPTMRGRALYKAEVEWEASHSLFLSTNYDLIIEETDIGTWRRLSLMKFPYTFKKQYEGLISDMHKRGEEGLRARLTLGEPNAAHQAVLSWLVDGALMWYRLNKVMPRPPQRIADDTHHWRTNSDSCLAYINDRLVFEPGAHVKASDLTADVNQWLVDHAHRPWSDVLVASRFGSHPEFTQREVIKKKVKASDRLSRRPMRVAAWSGALEYTAVMPIAPPTGPESAPEPTTYMAWIGVSFRT